VAPAYPLAVEAAYRSAALEYLLEPVYLSAVLVYLMEQVCQ
jgi:hypothetical protein